MFNQDFVVFHGTNQFIHMHNEFVTCAFFSTTTSLTVAQRYAGAKGIVYVCKIPSGFPFINFSDTLEQILLPIGTRLIVSSQWIYKDTTFVYCTVEQFNAKQFKVINEVVSKP